VIGIAIAGFIIKFILDNNSTGDDGKAIGGEDSLPAGGSASASEDVFRTGDYLSHSKAKTTTLPTELPLPEKKAFVSKTGEYIRAVDTRHALEPVRSAFIWFYATNKGAASTPLVSYTGTSSSKGSGPGDRMGNLWTLEALPDGYLKYCAYGSTGTQIGSAVSQSGNLQDGGWHCVGFVKPAEGGLRLYIDGVPVLMNVVGNLNAPSSPRTANAPVLLFGAQYHRGAQQLSKKLVRIPADFVQDSRAVANVADAQGTGLSNFTAWSVPLTEVQVSALSEPYEMVNPLQFITDRAASLLSWFPLWDSQQNNINQSGSSGKGKAKDARGNITGAEIVRSTSSRAQSSSRTASESMGGGIKKGKLPPPVAV
jgi:hypothetical protein